MIEIGQRRIDEDEDENQQNDNQNKSPRRVREASATQTPTSSLLQQAHLLSRPPCVCAHVLMRMRACIFSRSLLFLNFALALAHPLPLLSVPLSPFSFVHLFLHKISVHPSHTFRAYALPRAP